ncbi:hypothetical protein PV08_00159 [Exophiala spinifera]|uniref:Uncharacterized protein n=1 Tax=Exophiala spinifera TaxID=91928 RepID=A0A0D1YWD5_9EURO|nr:uncharacterized protein PV08_00159 [Exophiala spinifera]KIW19586.1 hypothetical protein PV08_00159 [Exophiala spinifera]
MENLQAEDGLPLLPLPGVTSLKRPNFESKSSHMGLAEASSEPDGVRIASDHPGSQISEPFFSFKNSSRYKGDKQSIRIIPSASEITLSTIASRLSVPEPWEHDTPDEHNADTVGNTARKFQRGPQCWKVLLSGLPQLLLTVTLCISILLVYYVYLRKGAINQADQALWNYLTLALYLILPMSLSSAFKGYARSYRWQLLSTRYLGLEEFDLVLGCESLIASTQLLWKGRVKGRLMPSRIQWYCAVSLLLNLGLQVAVSVLGVIASLTPSREGIDYSQYGSFSIADFNNPAFFPDNDTRSLSYYIRQMLPFPDEYPTYYFPNFYGNLIWPPWGYRDKDSSSRSIFCIPGDPGCKIYLSASGPEISSAYTNITIFSYHSISAVATCQKYNVTHYPVEDEPIWDPFSRQSYVLGNITFFNESSGQITTIPWNASPVLGQSIEPPTFMWAAHYDTSHPSSRSATVMMLHRVEDRVSLFDCHSEVLPLNQPTGVHGVDLYPVPAVYNIPDEVAQNFAGAIAGRFTVTPKEDPKVYCQYSPLFDDEELVGVTDEWPPEKVASVIRTFTLSALRSFDLLGPRITVAGIGPQQAQKLTINWDWAIGILVGIPVIQWLLLCLTAYISSAAIIKDTSYLATAHLLKPVTENLGSHGCIMSGHDIAHHLGNLPIIYGVRCLAHPSDEPIYHLDVIRQSEDHEANLDNGWKAGMDMPEGWYDGSGRQTMGTIFRQNVSTQLQGSTWEQPRNHITKKAKLE